MNIKRILVCIILALAAFYSAFPAEPTALEAVKTLVVRDGAPTAKTAICISVLEDRLGASGFTTADADSADAEMTVTLSVGDGSDDDIDVDYLIKIASLPSRRELFRFHAHQQNTLESACKWMAKRTLSKIAEAKKRAAVPEPRTATSRSG